MPAAAAGAEVQFHGVIQESLRNPLNLLGTTILVKPHSWLDHRQDVQDELVRGSVGAESNTLWYSVRVEGKRYYQQTTHPRARCEPLTE